MSNRMVYFLKQIGFLGIIFFSMFAYGQSKAKKYIIEGNEYYHKGKYDKAEYAYKKAILEDPISIKANYNLGNTLFQQKRYKESLTHYKKAAEISKTKDDKHLSYHNLGNAYMQEKDYQKAIDNYKNALKNNPNDDATRYNYALAKKMLEKEKEEQKKNKDQKNNKNQENQNQESQSQQQNNKQNKENQESQKKPQDQDANQQNQENKGIDPKPGGENGNNKGQGSNLSSEMKQGNKEEGKDNAKNNENENLLKALQNQEAKTQRKIIQQKTEKQRTTTSKDW